MIPSDFDLYKMQDAVRCGGIGDLRFACDFADCIVQAALKAGDQETLRSGFAAYRARNDYIEDHESEPGNIHIHPHIGEEISAPPKDKTRLGRFNAPLSPVLYLSAAPEIALAETRALPSDTCTVAVFKMTREVRIAKLLRVDSIPIDVFFEDEPGEEMLERWLLAQAARFVSRRVSDANRDLHYRVCNLIGSAFKERDFDGLAYRTSFWSKGWRQEGVSPDEDNIKSSNIVLFYPKLAEVVQSSLWEIDWLRPTAERAHGSIWTAKT